MGHQAIDAPLTASATFLVFSAPSRSSESVQAIRGALSSLGDTVKNVSIRHSNARLSCVAGIGSSIWDILTEAPKPAELRPFAEVRGEKHYAVSTPGDLLFHIRAERRDMCFELERQLMLKLGDAVRLEDHTSGFRYFDARDLLGFIDGTANPTGEETLDAVRINAETDKAAADGSYIMVQKYLHNLQTWDKLSIEQQESIIGRKKLDNIELDDAEQGQQQSHKTLTTIEDDEGNEHDILRDNMPFGMPSSGEFGTYFIGYSRDLWVMERMLQRMYVGNPPGLHDRILDFSTPVTGSTFFAPSTTFLEGLGDD